MINTAMKSLNSITHTTDSIIKVTWIQMTFLIFFSAAQVRILFSKNLIRMVDKIEHFITLLVIYLIDSRGGVKMNNNRDQELYHKKFFLSFKCCHCFYFSSQDSL